MDHISFVPIDQSVIEKLLKDCPSGCDRNELSDILESLSYMLEEVPEIAVSLLPDSLAVRIYDGERYLFVSPIGLTDGWDIKGCIEKIGEYAVKEMIPLVFTDVPRDSIQLYSEVFRMPNVSVYDDDDDLFFVFVDNECSILENVPSMREGNLSLRKIEEKDQSEYARLCRDKELNKYWGYDVSEDNPADEDEYFLDVAKREFNTGVALTLGAYLDETFIGEAVFYAFDYKGGASFAIRVFPEYQNKGLGKRIMSLVVSLASKIGILVLYSEVIEANLPSLALMSRFMEEERIADGKVYFVRRIG